MSLDRHTMVTPNCYSTDVRRYGNRMNLYTSYPERRGAYTAHPDTRTTIMGDREDDVTPQRKRIAVACGRCRKRKIRCSGDTGNGGPCTNCKNAGYEPCQFLRVASQETPMKNESFTYSLEASRQYQARGSSTMPSLPSTTPSYPDGLPPYTNDSLVYRAPSAFYGVKPYCPLSTWSQGYTDEQGYNYGLYQPSFPSVHDSDYGIGYRIASGASGKSALCVDTEPNYAYSSASAMTHLPHRPAQGTADSANLAFQSMVPDSKSLAFQNMTASVNMGDRVLPVPVGRSTMSGSSYKNDSGSSTYSGSSSKSSQASTSETSPVSSTSETPSSYTSYEPSSMVSAASCVPSYPPITLASQFGRASNDLYSHTGSSDAAMFTSTNSMRHGPDMTYRYEDTTTTVTAAVSSTARRDLPNLNGSGIGSLALGHSAAHYLPHQSASYMLPTGDLGGVGTDTAADNYRKSAGALRA